MRVLIIALILMLLPLTAQAASDATSCTQQGLLDAGFDPNGVDGSIGRGTRAASESYRKGPGSGLPKLTNATAQQWCTVLSAHSLGLSNLGYCKAEDLASTDFEHTPIAIDGDHFSKFLVGTTPASGTKLTLVVNILDEPTLLIVTGAGRCESATGKTGIKIAIPGQTKERVAHSLVYFLPRSEDYTGPPYAIQLTYASGSDSVFVILMKDREIVYTTNLEFVEKMPTKISDNRD